MTYGMLLKEGEEALFEGNIKDSKVDAWLLMEYVINMDRAVYYLHIEETAPDKTRKEYFELIEKRKRHIPLQYITGCQEFMGFNFTVNDKVLIPRQDTEILAERALKYTEGKSVLDICTGSGCIAISLALLGNPCRVTASDKSEDALFIAELNAKKLNADITFVKSDLFEKIKGRFDIIVSNPPYISEREMKKLEPEVGAHEPSIALWGGMDGLFFYRSIIKKIKSHLNKNGRVLLETGCGQAKAVSGMLLGQGFKDVLIIKDYAGLDRVVEGRI